MRTPSMWRTLAIPASLALAMALGQNNSASADDDKPKKEERRREVMIFKPDGGSWTDLEGEMHALSGRGYLGVELVEMTPELLRHFGVRGEHGVLIARVEKGGPADKAGIEVGDILTSIDDSAVDSSWDVRSRVRSKEANETAAVEIFRQGNARTVQVTIGERERSEVDVSPLFLKRRDGENVVIELEPGKIERRIELRDSDGHGDRLMPLSQLRDHEEGLKKRLQELEKRIQELERLLEKKN